MNSIEIWIIRRRKFGGTVWHYGVLLPNGIVVEFSELGMRFLSCTEFAAGQDVQHCRSVPISEHRRIQSRIEEFQRNPRTYDLANWNCEKFANWLAGDSQPKSEQVRVFIAIAAVLGLAWLFIRTA